MAQGSISKYLASSASCETFQGLRKSSTGRAHRSCTMYVPKSLPSASARSTAAQPPPTQRANVNDNGYYTYINIWKSNLSVDTYILRTFPFFHLSSFFSSITSHIYACNRIACLPPCDTPLHTPLSACTPPPAITLPCRQNPSMRIAS